MKNLNIQEDELIQSLLSEAGTEVPSKDFHLKILSRIEKEKSISYQPLISPKAMRLILGGILLLGIFTFLFIPEGEKSLSYWDKFPELTPSILNINIPRLTIPKIQLGPVFNTSLLAFSLLMFSWMIYTSKRLNIE